MNTHEWQGVVDFWRTSCAQYPNRVAIKSDTVQWTYGDLERRVDAWIAAIAQSSPETNIGIQLPHDAEAIAALLGIFSSGRCSVPFDRTEPGPRRLGRLQLSDSKILISRKEDAAELFRAGWSGQVIDPADVNGRNGGSSAAINGSSSAYLHFTSGSSGRPKAVEGLHRTIACAVTHLQAMIDFTVEDRHAFLSPLGVPAALAQIFTVFSAGAELHIFDPRSHNLTETIGWLIRRRITTMQIVPSFFRAIAREAAGEKLLPALRAVKLGGEAATASDARLFAVCAPDDAILINGLGLTEAGFNVCWWKWHPGDDLNGGALPIGRPPPGLELVIAPSGGTIPSNGEVGEIVVRSPALPAGYWRNPELSAEVYRELPDRPGWRELRTGDAGFWRNDGVIEHKGRLDDLAKIRGYRVAPAEVEAALLAIRGVSEAAVVVGNKNDGARLHAFVQPRSNTAVKSEALRKKLGAALPAHLVPAHICLVDSLPRLSNGKIDRVRLSEKTAEPLAEAEAAGIDPDDPVRLKLLRLWREVLGSKEIGSNDDFFALGGDSLSAMTMLAAVEKSFGLRPQISDWLEAPTLQALGDLIGRSVREKGNSVLVALRREGNRPPLFCLPSSGSNAFEFRFLASQIDENQPLFAFEFPGLDGQICCPESIEELVQLYLKALRSERPHGPYHLCGTSFGGTLALEMARCLVRDGEKVAFLGLLDVRGPGYPRPRKKLGWRDRAKLALLPFLPRFERASFSLSTLRRGFRDRIRRWLVRRFIQIDSYVGRRISPCPRDWLPFYAQEVTFAATKFYQPEPFPGKFDLFRSEHQPPANLFEEDPLLGWSGLAAGGIEVHSLPGHHNMYLREGPIVALLARELEACLDRKC